MNWFEFGCIWLAPVADITLLGSGYEDQCNILWSDLLIFRTGTVYPILRWFSSTPLIWDEIFRIMIWSASLVTRATNINCSFWFQQWLPRKRMGRHKSESNCGLWPKSGEPISEIDMGVYAVIVLHWKIHRSEYCIFKYRSIAATQRIRDSTNHLFKAGLCTNLTIMERIPPLISD